MNETFWKNVLNWILNIRRFKNKDNITVRKCWDTTESNRRKIKYFSQSYISRIQRQNEKKKLKKIMDGKKSYNPKCKFIRKRRFFCDHFL